MYRCILCIISTLLLYACEKEVEFHSPNIVLILADDMGYGDIQAYNPESHIPTPNLNSLAEEGIKFTDAHTNSAVCTPTRYGLLTGRYAWRTRLKKHVLSGYSAHLIDPNRATIASILKSRGYNTAVVGKWHLGLDYPWKSGVSPEGVNDLNYCAEDEIDYEKPVKNGPNELGFDYSFLVPGSLDMSPYVYLENGMATAIPDSISPKVSFPAYTRRGEIAPDFTHESTLDKLTEKAVKFIHDQANKEAPFMLYFPLTGPHKPALTARRFVGKSGYGPYGDLVMQVDWTVGQVLEALKDNQIEDNTLVIYTSDNGSYMFRIDEAGPDHVDDEKVQGYHENRRQSNYIWRGTKADIYDGGHRVPFIVRWPQTISGGVSNSSTICLTDILATITEIQGLEQAGDVGPDSFSFYSLLLGDADFQRPPIIHHSVNGTFSIRHGKWKMIFSDGSGGRQQPIGKPFNEPYQLYNLEKDPSESINVLNENTEVAEILTGYLQQIQDKGTSQGFTYRN